MAKILVVDDNSQLNSMLKDVLESWDYTVLLSEDGFSCLDLARKEKPDIILLDIMLRGLSGYEVCSELKKDPCTQEPAVILMTALSDVQSRIHGYGGGADIFLTQPITYDEIHVIITQCLQRRQRHQSMEPRYAVAETLNGIFTLAAGCPTPLNATKLAYCNKLLQSLHWTPEEEEKARIVSMLFPVNPLFQKADYGLEQLLAAIQPLQMSAWLTPAIRFLAAPPDGRDRFLPALERQHCKKPAFLALLVAHYITLCKENGGDRRRILEVLRREPAACHYDEEILHKLTELINAEIVLETIG